LRRAFLIAVALAATQAVAANVTGPAFAWSENAGWVNLAPASGPGVTITSSAMVGNAWAENLGWINLSPTPGGVTNDGIGRLSGYAWSENAGWINFRPRGAGVSIDPASGRLQGYAWGENVGWIKFNVATPATTTWRPDPAVFDPVADSDSDGIPNGIELAELRDPFVKDNDIFALTRLFAMQQYRDFLAREGEAAGISFWTTQMDTGAQPRDRMVETFFNSAEFQGVIAPVTRLYFAYFLRIPDYDGLNYWIGQSRSGVPLAAISDAFAASPEFQQRYGSLSNAQFVSLVYQNILGRPADATGLAFWTGQLNAGLTRGAMMIQFSESAEYSSVIGNDVYVTMMYVGMLRRSPEQGGFDFWVGYMDAGNSGLDLIGGFLAAPEYRNRFLP
jgi:hypothetical protein